MPCDKRDGCRRAHTTATLGNFCKYGDVSRGADEDSPPVNGEMRRDVLTGDWVNVVGNRQSRPNLPDDGCPFCVGGLEAPEPYDVRWFANRWPALAPGAAVDFAAAEAAAIPSVPAVGACEVVLFSPEHDESLASLGVEQARKVVDVWADAHRGAARPARDRIRARVREPRARGGRDDRPSARADLRLPLRAARPARELQPDGSCAVCREVAFELDAGARVVAQHGDWVAWVPFASGYAYGMRFAPRTHIGSIPALDDAARDDLARLLVDALGRYDRLWPAADARRPVPVPHVVPPGARARRRRLARPRAPRATAARAGRPALRRVG